MRISDKTKRVTCLLVAVSLIIPLAISIITMFIGK